MAEAVGLVLAVLPLVISALEHYSKAASKVSRFRRYDNEISKLSTRLRVQRAIFTNANRRLLTACVSPKEAVTMLEDPDHPVWTEENTERLLIEQLGDNRGAFVESITLISGQLCNLEEEYRKLEAIHKESGEGNSIDVKAWGQRTGKKIRHAFRESHISSLFDDLRDATADFCLLLNETHHSETCKPIAQASATTARKEIVKLAMIKTAAKNLYETLGAACTKHTDHQVQFSLQASHQGSSPIRFNLAFRHLAANRNDDEHRPVWLAIESRVSGSIKLASTNRKTYTWDLGPNLKRGRASPTLFSSGTQEKRKRTVKICSSALPMSCENSEVEPPLSNLCTHHNLCNQLAALLSQSHCSPNRCIGFLEDSARSRHLVYVDARVQSLTHDVVPSASPSLRDFFQIVRANRASDRAINAIPQIQQLRLAKQLAMALLSFHATPWLKSSWSSSDVYFYGVNSLQPEMSTDIQIPYVNVAVKGPHHPITRSTTLPSRTFAPNPFLFGLGVMLLEIAFESPLHALHRPIDLGIAQDDQHTEFFTAKRVSRTAPAPLGERYAKILRKCLQCDFGHGDDLGDSGLQERVYCDVINELDILEELLRKFDLDD